MHCNNGLNNKIVETLVENKVAQETGDLKYLQDSMYDFVKTLKEIILGEYSPEFFNRYVDEALKLHGSNLEEFLKIPKMGLELRQALNSIDDAIDISNQEFRDNLVLLLDKFQTTLDNMEYEARDPYDTAVELGFQGTKQEWLEHLEGDSAYVIAVKNGYEGTQAEWLKYIRADGFIQSIQQFATNDSETKVQIPDYGTINSLQGYIKELFENGGLPATPFATKALMSASALVDGTYALVTDDATDVNNGLYVKKAGGWVFSKYNFDAQMNMYLKTKGSAVITPYAPSSIDYISATQTLNFSNTIYVDSRNSKFRLTTPISLSLPNEGVYRIEANETTKTLRAVGAISDNAVDWLVCGYVMRTPEGSGIATTMFEDYLVNGVAQGSVSAKTNYSLILSTPASLNFDFTGNKIDVTGDLWLAYDGGRKLISTQSIDLSPTRERSTAFQSVLLVNPTTSKLVLKEASGGYTVPKDHIVVGGYRESDLLFYGLDNFSVNGVPFNKSGGGSGGVRPAFGWSPNNKVEVGVVDSYTTSDPFNFVSKFQKTSDIYALYDALVAAYPDYVTKTNLGNDASGTIPIYQYRFKPVLIDPQIPSVKAVLPKIMLLSLHNEGINFVYVYTLMREICNSWSGNEALTSLRFGTEFVVIPVLNPWGLDNMSRTNSNSVDINRNFPVGWIPIGAVGNAAYSGTAALTESESQIGWAAMQAEKPDIYYDCHSYGPWNNEGQTVWVSIANDKTKSAATSACTKIYAQYREKYTWLVGMDKLMHFSNANVNDGATSAKAAQSLGVIGGNLELAWSLKNEPTGLAGHTSVINFTTDFLGTLILQSIGVFISGSK